MTDPLDGPLAGVPVRTRWGLLRELVGLLLLIAGVAAVLGAADAVDWRLCLALAGAGAIGAGLWMGRDNEPAGAGDGEV